MQRYKVRYQVYEDDKIVHRTPLKLRLIDGYGFVRKHLKALGMHVYKHVSAKKNCRVCYVDEHTKKAVNPYIVMIYSFLISTEETYNAKGFLPHVFDYTRNNLIT